MSNPRRILGIDTSLRSTGIAVVDRSGSGFQSLEFDILHNPRTRKHSECLKRIYDGVLDVIGRTSPDAASIEGIFHCKNVRTAVTLGQARGAALTACAMAGIPVYEYSPRKVKQSVCGTGAAHKDQVAKMVTSILALDKTPRDDESDALAIAICHFHSLTSVTALAPDAI